MNVGVIGLSATGLFIVLSGISALLGGGRSFPGGGLRYWLSRVAIAAPAAFVFAGFTLARLAPNSPVLFLLVAAVVIFGALTRKALAQLVTDAREFSRRDLKALSR
jgi:hypothetical protein